MDSKYYEYYNDARNKGKKLYNQSKARGKSGHLTSLDGVLKDAEIVSTVELGVMDIPIDKVVGTYSNSRRMMFAKNFMPLESRHTEFASKWISLCEAHINEGIRDPIKAYEYMNYFYVMEGNKRVSVLKYFGAVSVQAKVIRLIPKYDETNEDIVNYYAFLEFYKRTKILDIWFTKHWRYERLLGYLDGYDPEVKFVDTKYEYFMNFVYNPFKKILKSLGGDTLPVTTGDAFIMYARLYGFENELDEDKVRKYLPSLMKELENYESDEEVGIMTDSDGMEKQQTGILDMVSSFIPHKKLKIGFVYSKEIRTSGWTYSHELGRRYIDKVLGDEIETSYIENIDSPEKAERCIGKMTKQGFDVIFTASETLLQPTLKAALENPDIKFLNCSGSRPFVHLSNYLGRTYETRFLTGLIAGAMTNTNIIGYSGMEPNSEGISSVNAFALGAKLVNPDAKVHVKWQGLWATNEWADSITSEFISNGADVIANKHLHIPKEVTWKHGIYSMLGTVDSYTGKVDKYLAAPYFNWGIFYEKIVGSILSGSYGRITSLLESDKKMVNFWWGLASGVIDVYYDKEHMPAETVKLVEFFKKMISTDQYHPFSGPILDNEKQLRVEEGSTLPLEAIIEMDWFVDNVILYDK